jgi:hypothetical protein
MNTTTVNVEHLDEFANQKDTVFVRIFYKGKFVNYFFEPDDVENLGLSNIFDSIDPDPDWVQAKKDFENFGVEREKVLAERVKKKQAKLSAAR